MANFFANAAEEAKKIPWWGWVVGGGAVLLFGSHLLNRQSSATPTDAASGDTSGDTSGDSGGDMGTAGPPPPEQLGSRPPPSSSPPPPAGKPPPPKTTTYTVRSGDTLNLIASRYHVDEPALYSMNSGVIEATAKAHGFSSSDHGHWIFPGEVLKIPA